MMTEQDEMKRPYVKLLASQGETIALRAIGSRPSACAAMPAFDKGIRVRWVIFYPDTGDAVGFHLGEEGIVFSVQGGTWDFRLHDNGTWKLCYVDSSAIDNRVNEGAVWMWDKYDEEIYVNEGER